MFEHFCGDVNIRRTNFFEVAEILFCKMFTLVLLEGILKDF
jgi:hypothetical protein